MVRLAMYNGSRLGPRGLATTNNPQRSLGGSDSMVRMIPRFTPRAAFNRAGTSNRGYNATTADPGSFRSGDPMGGGQPPVLPPPGITPTPNSGNQPTRADGGYGVGQQNPRNRGNVVYRPTFSIG